MQALLARFGTTQTTPARDPFLSPGPIRGMVWAKEENMEFGDQMRQLRKREGLTQEQLAQRLMVTRQAVSNWERGVRQNGLTGFCPAMIQR